MGVSESRQLLGSVHNWREVQAKRAQIEGNPSVVQDELSSQVADCYEIPMQHHLNYQLKFMINRKNIDEPSIIKVIDAQIKEKTILECGTMDVVQVFTEAIYCRFEQIQLADFENMFVLQQVLRACQVLMDLAGNYFMLNTKMIGFTENGRIKVWLNENFGKHQINQQALLRNEQQMVKGIIQAFANKFTRKYQFFETFTFFQASCAIQNILKSMNKIVIQSQIQNKLKKRHSSQCSSKKLSVSQKSINAVKIKASINHRSSIDRSIQRINHSSQIKISQSKENHNFKFANQISRFSFDQPAIKMKKSIINNMSTSIKISLADVSMSNIINFAPILPQRPSAHYSQKPLIRINYENHPINSEIYHQNANINSKLTCFPKEQCSIPIIVPKPVKRQSLRRNYRRCSQIVERSEQGQNTERQVSQTQEQYDSQEQRYGQRWQNQKMHFQNPFEPVGGRQDLWM